MTSTARRRRLRAVLAATATAVAATGTATFAPTAASAADPCTTPQLADVMVSQGLPSYRDLARGKTTLVRFFLSTPGCLPAGTTIAVVGADLLVDGQVLPLAALSPLPQLGSVSTAPVPAAASDVAFYLPGSAVAPADDRLDLSVTIDYVVRSGGKELSGEVAFSSPPGTDSPLQRDVARDAPPVGVLVVPMGNAAAADSTQWPGDADTALQTGMTALNRLMPVADEDGIRWHRSAGLLNLGARTVAPRTTVNYMPDGTYCGDELHMTYISKELQARRTLWNAVSTNSRAQTALGQVWQGISKGRNTELGSACAEGFAQYPGSVGWGRTIARSHESTPTDPKSVTGTLAAHEIMHNVAGVSILDPRHDGTLHSENLVADLTAPDRGFDVFARAWLPAARSVMNYQGVGWHDRSSLYEKGDWDRMQCAVVPPGPLDGLPGQPRDCELPGQVTFAGAVPAQERTIVVTGSSDGTPAGTDAHSYDSADRRTDPTDPDSAYRLVQLDAQGGLLQTDGVPFADTYDDSTAAPRPEGTFGLAVRAHPATARIELRKEGVAEPLHVRERNAAPRVVSQDVGDTNLTLSVLDEHPGDLRLDLLLECPGATSPLATALRPTVSGPTAVFVTEYDTSLGCADGTVRYQVSDGLQTATGEDPDVPAGASTALASIYAPADGGRLTSGAAIAVAGAGRAVDGTRASELVWSLKGPSTVDDVVGSTAAFVPPEGGFRPGQYELTLAARVGTTVVAQATRTLTVLLDSDGDLLPDLEDRYCSGASAAQDAGNALADSDVDGVVDGLDPAPCRTAATAVARFTPQSLNTGSQGNPVTVQLTSSTTDLQTLTAADLFIVRLAGHTATGLLGSATALPAVSYKPVSATEASVVFDRRTVESALTVRDGLDGYIPLYVGTLDGRVRAADPSAPYVFP